MKGIMSLKGHSRRVVLAVIDILCYVAVCAGYLLVDYLFLNDAIKAAERIIKQVNLNYLYIYIYEYDSKNNMVTKIKEVDPNVILGNSTSNKKGYLVEIIVDPSSGRLRARADDGIHGPAYVAFPNSLRVPGAKYYAEKLIWNGKNYRASGDIIPV